MPSLKKFREMAGLPSTVRRWSQAAARVQSMSQAENELAIMKASKQHAKWHPQVHKAEAMRDGLKPEDFRFEQWPVSNVRLRNIKPGEYFPKDIALIYRCDMPATTPHANQYSEDGQKIPDPTGMALSWVKFELRDAETHFVLDKDLRDHADGKVTGMLGGRCQLWKRLLPGGDAVRVRLHSVPMFYFLKDDGAAMLAYSNRSDGYFAGQEESSPEYSLIMDYNGEISLNG